MTNINTLEQHIREVARAELKRELEEAFKEARLYTASSSFGRETALHTQKEDGRYYPVATPQHALDLIQTVCFESHAPRHEKIALEDFVAQRNDELLAAKQDAKALEKILAFLRKQDAEMKEAEDPPTADDWNALCAEIKHATRHREEW